MGDAPATVGFLKNDAAEASQEAYDTLRARILESVRKQLRPELLNRFDDILVFRALTREAMEAILDVELQQLRTRLATNHIRFELNAKARACLLEEGSNLKQGARPLRRAITRLVEDTLADALLQYGDSVDTFVLTPEAGEGKPKRLVAKPKAKAKSKSTPTKATSKKRK